MTFKTVKRCKNVRVAVHNATAEPQTETLSVDGGVMEGACFFTALGQNALLPSTVPTSHFLTYWL